MSGVIDATPESYAKHLAGYIRDVSTIRARTLAEFGRSPPLKRIAYWREEIERERTKPWNFYLEEKYDDHPRFRAKPRARPTVTTQAPEFSAPTQGDPDTEPPVFGTPPWRQGGKCADELIAAVAKSFGLTLGHIRSPSRQGYVTRVRHLVAVLMWERGNDCAQVGRWICRDHSTVIHSRKVLPSVMAEHPPIAEAYAHFRQVWGIG